MQVLFSYIYSNPHLDAGQLIVGTSENSTGTFFCQTPKFVEGLFVLVYYSNEKRMKIYYNGVLCFDEVKTFNPWDTSQEVFLAKTRFLIGWQTESDFNMAGLGFYDRTLSETEIIEYCKNALPENPSLYLPLSEGDNRNITKHYKYASTANQSTVTIPNFVQEEFSSGFISMFINVIPTQSDQYIMSIGNDLNMIRLSVEDNTTLVCKKIVSGFSTTITCEIEMNTWMHIVFTWDISSLNIYINMLKQNQVSSSDQINIPIGSALDLIGACRIRDLLIYNRVLNSVEIYKLYNDLEIAGAVGIYKFDNSQLLR